VDSAAPSSRNSKNQYFFGISNIKYIHLLAIDFLRLQEVTSEEIAQRAGVAQSKKGSSTKITSGTQRRVPENANLFGFRGWLSDSRSSEEGTRSMSH